MKYGGWALSLALSACAPAPAPSAIEAHDAFYLWAGVPARAEVLDRARTLYVLAGEIRARGPARFESMRGVPRLGVREVWLVVRAERLDWSEDAWRDVLDTARRWQSANPGFAGVQIDFDAATRGLDRYGAFLGDVRRRLPGAMRLSVTGLLDNYANGDPAALASLAGALDEVVVQTYQGRRTVPGYERYLAAFPRLAVPHKVAVVEGGEWRAPPALLRDPLYRGTVLFVLPR